MTAFLNKSKLRIHKMLKFRQNSVNQRALAKKERPLKHTNVYHQMSIKLYKRTQLQTKVTDFLLDNFCKIHHSIPLENKKVKRCREITNQREKKNRIISFELRPPRKP